MGEQRLAHGRTVRGIAPADARRHAHGTRRLDLLEIEDLSVIQDAEVCCLAGFARETLEMGPCALAEPEAGEGFGAEFEELETHGVLATRGAPLDEAMALQHHQETVD